MAAGRRLRRGPRRPLRLEDDGHPLELLLELIHERYRLAECAALRELLDACAQRREPARPEHAAAALEAVDRAPEGLGVAARERGARLGALVARRVEELRDQALEGVGLALELVAAELRLTGFER